MLTGRKDSWVRVLAWSSASFKTFNGFFFFFLSFFFAVKMISKLLEVEDEILHYQGPSVSRYHSSHGHFTAPQKAMLSDL